MKKKRNELSVALFIHSLPFQDRARIDNRQVHHVGRHPCDRVEVREHSSGAGHV